MSGQQYSLTLGRNQRMLELLSRAESYPLVALIAGPGYGKTRIVEDYLQNRQDQTVWVTLDETDNSTEHFWRKLVRAGFLFSPTSLQQMERLGFPGTVFGFRTLMQKLSTYLLVRKRCFLVFDNFERIDNSTIIALIQRMALEKQRGLQIFILSRVDPQINVTALIMKGDLFPITAEDLSCSIEESQAMLLAMDCVCVQEELEELHARFFGRPAALLLAGYCQMLPGQRWDIDLWSERQMMERLVLVRCSPDTLRAMERVSIFSSFDARLWQETVGEGSVPLDKLAKTLPFLERVPFSSAYTFSCALRSFLLERLEKDREEWEQAVQFAAAYYRQGGMLEESLSFYALAQEYPSLLNGVVELFSMGPRRCHPQWLLQQAERIPEEILVSNGIGELVYAALLLFSHRWEAAEQRCDLLVRQKEHFAFPNEEEGRYFWGEVYAFLGMMSYLRYSEDLAFYFRLAAQQLPYGSRLFGAYMVEMDALPHCCYGEKVRTAKDFVQMLQVLRESNANISAVMQGSCAGIGLMFEAEYAYLQGELEQAETLAYQCVQIAAHSGQHVIVQQAQYVLVRICFARGDRSNAFSLLKIMRKQAATLCSIQISHRFGIVEAAYYLTTREYAKVPDWIQRRVFEDTSVENYVTWMQYYMHAWYLLQKNRHYELEEFLPVLDGLPQCGAPENIGIQTACAVIKALSQMMLKRPTRAVVQLHRAYQTAQLNHISMPFVEHGRMMMQLIDEARSQRDCLIPAQWLDEIYEAAHHYAEHNGANQELHKVFKLTPKEMEVLHLIAGGLSNADIAIQLSTTVPTVKWYAQQIYNKLGVKNRTEAAQEAHNCGLSQSKNML